MTVLALGTCTVDLGRRDVFRGAVRFTPLEWGLLAYLAKHVGRVIDRDELLTEVWGYRAGIRTRAVDNTVARLRKKIEVAPDQPRHIHSIRGGGYRFTASEPDAAPAAATEAPAPPVSDVVATFRDAELAELGATLAAHRVVTLTGPAGVGKSWLARHYAAASGVDVVHCELGDAADVAAVDAVLAGALQTTSTRVDDALAARGRCLVVFNDAERACDALIDRIPAWTRRAAEVVFILTSRTALHMTGSRQLLVGPLRVEDAVALYRQRVLEAGATPGDEGAITALVEQLDRLPLAIELVAARAGTLSEEQLMARLSEPFRLLRSRRRGSNDRHRSLDALIDRSVELLEVEERRALVQCAVFPGSFTAEAADAVLDLGDHWPVDALQALVETNLARVETVHGGKRLRLYRSVAAWSRRALDATPDAEEIGRSHAVFFAGFGDRVRLAGWDPATRRRMLAERDNLIAACEWAIRVQEASLVAPLTLASMEVVAEQGPLPLAERLAEEALAVPLDDTDRDAVVLALVQLCRGNRPAGELRDRALAVRDRAEERGDTARLLDAELVVGKLGYQLGAWEEAESASARALALAEQLGEDRSAANAHINLGVIARRRSDPERAVNHYQAALTLYGRHGDRAGQSTARHNLGVLLSSQGFPERARGHFEWVVAVREEHHDEANEAVTRIALSYVLITLGDVEGARHQLDRALALARALSSRATEMMVEGHRAELDALTGDVAAAEAAYLTVEQHHRREGNAVMESIALGNRGDLYLRQGEVSFAERCLRSAIDKLGAVGQVHAVGAFQGVLGDVMLAQDRLEEARVLYDEAEGRLRGRHRLDLAILLCRRAHLLVALGRVDEAVRDLDEAQGIADATSAVSPAPIATAIQRLRAVPQIAAVKGDATAG